MYYYDKQPVLSNEEFDNLKEELTWEGSKVVVLRWVAQGAAAELASAGCCSRVSQRRWLQQSRLSQARWERPRTTGLF